MKQRYDSKSCYVRTALYLLLKKSFIPFLFSIFQKLSRGSQGPVLPPWKGPAWNFLDSSRRPEVAAPGGHTEAGLGIREQAQRGRKAMHTARGQALGSGEEPSPCSLGRGDMHALMNPKLAAWRA